MKYFKNIIYNCKEAQIAGLESQAKPISFVKKLKLNFHLYYCKYCQRFLIQSKIIDKAMVECNHLLQQKPSHFLDENKAMEMQQKINTTI